MVVGAFEIAKAVELAERFLEWGAVHLKVKVGLDPATDIARVKAVREVAGPAVTIGVDGNCGWGLATAKRSLQALEKFDLRFAEQLVGTEDPDALAQLRTASTVPVMADESVFTPTDAWHLTTARAVDVLAVYPGKNAGIAKTMTIAGIAEAAGICCCMGSNLELGIATAAMLHAGVAAPAIRSDEYPGDYIGPLYHQADMIEEPLELGPQLAVPPEGPGLGVALDEKQLKKWRVD